MKRFFVLLIGFVLLVSLAACSTNQGNNQSDEGGKTDNTPLEQSPAEIEAAIADALGDGYLSPDDMPEFRLLKNIPDLDLDKVDSYVAKETRLSSHDTVIVVKCKEASYTDDVVKIFNDYLATLFDEIREYPVGVAKVENARLFKANDTVMFIIGGAPALTEEEEAKLAISEYKKIDAAIKELLGYSPKNLAIYKDK